MFKFLEKIPLYPFLIAIYPILYLLSENINEIGVSAGLRSALILFIACVLVFLFALILTRNIRKSGLVALFVILVFFLIFFVLYAPVYRGLRNVALFGHVLGRHRYLMPGTLFLLLLTAVAGILALRKTRGKVLGTLSMVLNLVALVLVAIPLITIISFSVKNAKQMTMAQADLPEVGQSLTVMDGNQPDIYYIILDMHTSDNVMLKLMDYDDAAFSDQLREIGFDIAECSRSNYGKTQQSLTSSLNMLYLQDLTDTPDVSTLYPMFQSSTVRRSLEEAGYQTIAFETGYAFTQLEDADEYYKPIEGTLDLLTYPGITPFESLIMQVSGGKILYETREQLSKRMQYIIDAPYVQYRERILYTLKVLPTLTEIEGPKFVFAHILAPHDPFVFDKDGNAAFRRTPFTMNQDPEFTAGYGWNEYSKAYVNELEYIHREILSIVKKIITESDTPPVIIIQGDHGIPRSGVDDAQFEIYNAYYFGGRTDLGISDTITPVNSFRILFNEMFGTKYPLLSDESFEMDSQTNQYTLFDVSFTCP